MVIGTFALMVASVVFIFALLFPETGLGKTLRVFLGKNILWVGFLLSLGAIVCSLIYSEFIGYPPCLFCWYLRIAIYPQALLFLMALIKRDKKILDYCLGLTVLGIIVSTTHVISENVGISPLPCEASGPSCLIRYVYEYGFITIPVMGLVITITMLFAILLAKRGLKTTVLPTTGA